jgi:hypothetical protein
LTKFSPDGTSLVFSTFVGGSYGEVARSVGLDGSGCIYVGGGTGSTDFPTINAFQEENHSSECDEGFVFKLSANGSGMIYSSYLGGSGCEFVEDIAVNTGGELYAVGVTDSSDFPLQDPIQSTINGWNDLFITKLSASGTSLVYSTFLGGSDYDQSGGIAIDNSGCAYVTGMTAGVGFPTVNAFQPANAGGEDGYVTKISADGSSLVYSTYPGGNSGEWLYDVKVDNTGAAYVTGFSSSSNYPTTPSAYQPTLLGPYAAVITKLSPSGSSLVYSTFLGGSSGAGATVLCLYNGSVFISGWTSSYDFPLVDPFKDFFCYESGVFIAQLSPDGSTLDFSSFISNSEYCYPADIAVDGSGNLYLAGNTSNFFPAYQGFQNTFGGGSYDGFVTKLVPSQYSKITVTSPNGGEYWVKGSTQTITWTAPDITENVKITLYYYQDYEQYTITVAESAPNTGSYTWTAPNISNSNCSIRIEDTLSIFPSDWSDANFTISSPPSITIDIPNGGELLYPGSQYPIAWIPGGIIEHVSIDYSMDGGNSWISIDTDAPGDLLYDWTVPDTPSTNCLVRVTDTASSSTDTSDALFTIFDSRSITVTSPNGNETREGGTAQNVTWTSTGTIANVKLEYSVDNGSSWSTIIDSIANSGTYSWTIPNTPSTNCLVRISDTSGPASDVSNSVFTIDPYPTITVTAPNGGETWIANTTHAITWSYTGTIAAVNLEYSSNNGSSWTSIASSVSNTGSYNWVIPYISSTNCLVRVSDNATTASDTGNAVFTLELSTSLTVTSPNGGESWVKRSTHTITWTWTGTVGNVKIQYTMNGGSSWTTITSSTANDGSHQWTLPNVTNNKTQCLVKITAINGSAVDTSDAFFTILK